MANLTDCRIKDILIDHILPYVGEYQFRFIALVNRYMYDVYTTAFPSKSTKFNDDTKELTDICIREFRSEQNIMICYNTAAYYKFVKRKTKKGHQMTLLQLAPFMLRHNNITEIATRAAGRRECLSTLMWLYWYCHSKYYTRAFVWEWDMVFVKASADNLFVVLKWAKEKTNIDICALAVKYRNSRVLKWYVHNGWKLSDDVCSNAVLRKDLSSIIWARVNEFPWHAILCSNAALNGDLYMLRWVRKYGCPWNAETCSNAALCGHLEIVQWARANECPWDSKTCSNAALRGHLDIIQWARTNGCPWDKYTLSNAKKAKHWNVYHWVRSNGCPEDEKKRSKRH